MRRPGNVFLGSSWYRGINSCEHPFCQQKLCIQIKTLWLHLLTTLKQKISEETCTLDPVLILMKIIPIRSELPSVPIFLPLQV